MKTKEIIKEINKLDLSEKLTLVEDIWDSIVQGNAVLPMPQWQKAELDKRYAEYKQGKQSLHNVHDVHQELKNKK